MKKMLSEAGARGASARNAAKFEQNAAFVETPGDCGAKRNRALEAVFFSARSIGQSGEAVRVKDEQDAAIIFASKFTDHQRAETGGSFPVDVASAVRGDVIAERVEILAAALGERFHGALNAGENLEKFRRSFDGWIDESFRCEVETPRFLQKAKGETGDDAKGFLAIDATLGKEKGNGLRDGFLPRNIRKIDRCFEYGGRSSVFLGDAFDAKREGGKSQFLVFEFEGSANGFSGENVFRKLQAHFDAGKCDGRENAGHEDGGDEAGENQEEKIVAGVKCGEGDEDDSDDVNPAFQGDAVLHAIADPAKRGAFGKDGNQSDGNPRGDKQSDDGGGAGQSHVAKLRGCAGIEGKDESDGQGSDGEEEGADGGAVGFGEEGVES